jgi:ABC-type sulfate/molybdate transport systems ATPase subunit
MNILAGLLEPDSGEIIIDNVLLTRIGSGLKRLSIMPALRGLGYVMQDAALFPHMTAHDNIAFGLDSQGLSKAEVENRIRELLSLVHIEDVADSYPEQLSGGQQKRLALARTLAVKPKVILMDEPLTSLDPDLKKQLMSDLKWIFQNLKMTVIYVTHDPEEAELMVDRIVRLEEGKMH